MDKALVVAVPDRWWSPKSVIGLAVALVCVVFVANQMQPALLLENSTPSGGDMGAHVWGPAFMRDHLLPQGRLTGWTPDWYAGFPAFQFYMVIPALAIVALNAGLQTPIAAIAAAVLIIGAILLRRKTSHPTVLLIAAITIGALLFAVPYGIAFKLISVSGLVAFPLCAWVMGRLARSPEPIPAMLALGATVFLFDTNFQIYGGNILSTLAGEFAFSISLSLTLLAIGLALRGMEEGKGRVLAAVIIALVALTHIIPLMYAMVALAISVVLSSKTGRLWPLGVGVAISLIAVTVADGTPFYITGLAVLAAVTVFVISALTEPEIRQRMSWLIFTGPIAALISAFWLLPFYLRGDFFNDMGWERLDAVGPAILTVPMKTALPIAAVGALMSFGTKDKMGNLFGAMALVSAAAVANLGEGALWNARLLPFFYLSVYLTAAVGIGLAVRMVVNATADDLHFSDFRVSSWSSVIALVAVLIGISMPLRTLPGGQIDGDGLYHWMGLTSTEASKLPTWVAWNYSGYEGKPAYREYHDVVQTMAEVGEGTGDGSGCGRAMWEYNKKLEQYGTPMALMLLPHWTGGCIGSMEGLYFESSATTPFHFLNQSMLSVEPSRAQRDLPYQNYNLANGVDQLQVMGVRYYMAMTDQAITDARASEELTEVAESQPFVIFEVDQAEIVQGLAYLPVVTEGRSEDLAGEKPSRFDVGWLNEAVTYYNNPAGFLALPAEDGPEEWDRVETLLPDDGKAIEPAVIDDIQTDTSSISFSVDEPGSPVLVKTSFFPNWKVSGADGPWRVGPNLMAVVPTENDVRLSYGRTLIDWLANLITVAGLAGLWLLARFDRRVLVGTHLAPEPESPPEQLVLPPDPPVGSALTEDVVPIVGWTAVEKVEKVEKVEQQATGVGVANVGAVMEDEMPVSPEIVETTAIDITPAVEPLFETESNRVEAVVDTPVPTPLDSIFEVEDTVEVPDEIDKNVVRESASIPVQAADSEKSP